jgi:hypothetical protein
MIDQTDACEPEDSPDDERELRALFLMRAEAWPAPPLDLDEVFARAERARLDARLRKVERAPAQLGAALFAAAASLMLFCLGAPALGRVGELELRGGSSSASLASEGRGALASLASSATNEAATGAMTEACFEPVEAWCAAPGGRAHGGDADLASPASREPMSCEREVTFSR